MLSRQWPGLRGLSSLALIPLAIVLAGEASASAWRGMYNGTYERFVVAGRDVEPSRMGVIFRHLHGRFITFEFATDGDLAIEFEIEFYSRHQTDDGVGGPVKGVDLVTYASDGDATRDRVPATGTCKRGPAKSGLSLRIDCVADTERGRFEASFLVDAFQILPYDRGVRVPSL